MRRALAAVAALCSLFGLAACGEKPQLLQSSRSDVPAFQGAADPFVVPGWKAGDKTSWEQALKVRTQNQNEYTKLSVAK
jgi:hypothetical protein